MNKQNFSNWLKFITILVGVVGLALAFLIAPAMGNGISERAPELAYLYWPVLGYVWLLFVPCFWALVEFWKICCEIGCDRSFSMKNAKSLAMISKLAIADVILWFVGYVVLKLVWNFIGIPFMPLVSVILVLAGIGIAVLTASLSHLTEKAARLKEENDLTV